MLNKRWRIVLTFGLVFLLVFSSSAAAFQDIGENAESAKILSLKERGLVSGIDGEHFAPNQELNFAQGVALIVSGMNLTKSNDRNDQASDVFAHVPANAWYHGAFTTALYHDLGLPKDVRPNETMTKEQFTHLLFQALLTTGDYAFIELYVVVADQADISPEYMDSIQKMLVTNIASLDEEQHFHPKNPITRAEAAAMLHDTLEFIAKQHDLKTKPPVDNPDEPVSSEAPHRDITIPVLPEPPVQICNNETVRSISEVEISNSESSESSSSSSGNVAPAEPAEPIRGPGKLLPCEQHGEVAYSVTAVNEDINRVIISWGEQPHPGYGLSIDKIEFDGTTAVVHYTRHYPDPDMMYPQVIVYPKAVTYVDSKYEIKLQDDTKENAIKKPNSEHEGGGVSGSLGEER